MSCTITILTVVDAGSDANSIKATLKYKSSGFCTLAGNVWWTCSWQLRGQPSNPEPGYDRREGLNNSFPGDHRVVVSAYVEYLSCENRDSKGIGKWKYLKTLQTKGGVWERASPTDRWEYKDELEL